MSEEQREPLKTRLAREREARIVEKRQLREAESAAKKDLDDFASQWNSQPRPTKNDNDTIPAEIKRSVTQTQPSTPPPPPPSTPPPAKPGVPIEFYCWKDGKMAVIHLYAMGEASPL